MLLSARFHVGCRSKRAAPRCKRLRVNAVMWRTHGVTGFPKSVYGDRASGVLRGYARTLDVCVISAIMESWPEASAAGPKPAATLTQRCRLL